jgi:hypothetical protein
LTTPFYFCLTAEFETDLQPGPAEQTTQLNQSLAQLNRSSAFDGAVEPIFGT